MRTWLKKGDKYEIYLIVVYDFFGFMIILITCTNGTGTDEKNDIDDPKNNNTDPWLCSAETY